MNPRTTGILLLVAAALVAFLYLYELGGEEARLEAEQRAKRLFRGIEPSDLRWIELRTRDGEDARLEQQDGEWRLVAPLDFPADTAAERMADTLASLGHEAQIESPRPDDEYGLDEVSARVVRFGVGDETRELRLGAKTPVGANVYARTGEAPEVYTVASHTAQAFDHSLLDLREKRVLDFDPTSVRGLEAHWPGGRVVLARRDAPADDAAEEAGDEVAAESEWRLTSPLEARADADAVERLLTTLSFLRADAFADAPSEAQRALLEPPDFAVTLERNDAQGGPLELAISRPDDGAHRWVRAAGDVLFRIPADRIEDFPRETVAYRQRRLASFSALDAQQIDFFFQDEAGDPVAITGERREGGWSSRPESFAAGKLSAAVAELARLEADDIVAESMGPEELDALGLAPPEAVITVLGARPESGEGAQPDAPLPVLAEVHFGRVTPKGVVARVAGAPEIWRLRLETVAQLPVSLKSFRDRFRAEPPTEDAPADEPGDALDPLEPAEESP